jgi:hypothetical protein
LWIDRGLGPVIGMWLITVAWSLLMLKEFFVPDGGAGTITRLRR